MARVRRTPKRRRAQVGPVELAFFAEEPIPVDANPFLLIELELSDRLPNGVRVRDLWEMVKDEILEAWISEKPGTRPRAWWRFDGPGEAPESGQAEYLARHGYLTPGERRALGRAARG